MSSSSKGPLPLADVLSRAAAELDAQAASVDAMHALAAGAGGGEALRAAQSVDTVAQHLRALAEVLVGLAAAAPAGAGVPEAVIEAVPLSDLAARLRGAPAPSAQDDGDFELL